MSTKGMRLPKNPKEDGTRYYHPIFDEGSGSKIEYAYWDGRNWIAVIGRLRILRELGKLSPEWSIISKPKVDLSEILRQY